MNNPPHDTNIECDVLGAILLEPDSLNKVYDFLEPDDFYDSKNRTIYLAIQDLKNDNAVIDLITLVNLLRENGTINQAGGEVYIAELTLTLSTSSNIKHHARILQKKKLLRNIIHMGKELQEIGAVENEKIEDTVQKMRNKLLEFEANINLDDNIATGEDILNNYIDHYTKKIDKKESGKSLIIPTGLPTLDSTAGLERGNLTILAAKTSLGKSAMSMNWAVHAAQEGYKVLFVSVEMNENMLMDRIMSGLAQIDNTFFKKASAPKGAFNDAVDGFAKFKNNLRIVYNPKATTSKISSMARKLKASEGIDLVVVDYIQILADPVKKNETVAQKVDNITTNLKQLAGECNCCVVALSQFNRSANMSSFPTLDQLRDSGATEQNADSVLIIHREKREIPQGNLRIAKNRTGLLRDIPIMFTAKTTFFKEMEVNKINADDLGF